jgi:hypothetical protein
MLRRGSSGFSRGVSRFRGVTRHHQAGKWEARIGRVDGSKYKVSGAVGVRVGQGRVAIAHEAAVMDQCKVQSWRCSTVQHVLFGRSDISHHVLTASAVVYPHY